MSPFQRAIILVADGVGCGGAPDAADYGDAGADTLGNLARAVGGLRLPNLEALGLGHLTSIAGVPAAPSPRGAWGAMREASAGKDTITGHWEMAGLVTDRGDADLPARLPAGDHRRSARGVGPRTAREQDRLGDGDHRGARPAAPGDGRPHPLHLGRLGPADRGARGSHPARGAVSNLRGGARDRRPPPDRPRDRAPVRRRPGCLSPHLQPARLFVDPADADAARSPRGGRAAGDRASARSPTSSPGEDSRARCTARGTPTGCA